MENRGVTIEKLNDGTVIVENTVDGLLDIYYADGHEEHLVL